MLRASVTKFKACSLAHIPRILRKDVWCSTCNIEKLSSIPLIKSKSTNSNEQAESEKQKRLIEMAFGSNTNIHKEPVIGRLEGPEVPQSQIETEAHVAISDFEKSGAVATDQCKIIGKFEKTKDTLNEVEHVNTNEFSCSDNDTSTKCQLGDNLGIYDKIAKQCLHSPGNKIDSKLLEHMEQLGILQSMIKNIPKIEDQAVELGCTKGNRKPRPKIEVESQKFDKERIKTPRRSFINRRAMRHIALRLGTFDISPLKTDIVMKPDKCKVPMKETELLEFKNVQNKVADDYYRQEQESQFLLNPFNSSVTGLTIDETKDENDHESLSPAMILSEEFADAQDYEVNFECCKQAGQSDLDIGLEEIKRIFDEEKIPQHTIMSLKPSKKRDQDSDESDMIKSTNDNTYPSVNDCKYSSFTISANSHTAPVTLGSNETAKKEDSHVNKIVQNHFEPIDHCRHSNAQSCAVLSTMLNKQVETNNLQLSESMMMLKKPNLNKDEDISLSEMLRRVRQRALLETVEQIVLTSQVTEANSSVVQKQAPCAPLASPPNPKVVPPRPCPCKRPKRKKSNPCAPQKSDPCQKFRRTTLVEALGLVVTRIPDVDVPHDWPDKADKEPIPRADPVMFVPESKYFVTSVNNINCPETKKVLNLIRHCELCDPFHKKR